MLVVWGSSSKGGFNFIFEMIFVQRQKSLNLYGLRLIGPKLWNELDERFKCRTSNQFKKELTSHFISLQLLIFTDILMVYIYLFIYLFIYFLFCSVFLLLCQVIKCISCASFLTFTVLIIIITVTQLLQFSFLVILGVPLLYVLSIYLFIIIFL